MTVRVGVRTVPVRRIGSSRVSERWKVQGNVLAGVGRNDPDTRSAGQVILLRDAPSPPDSNLWSWQFLRGRWMVERWTGNALRCECDHGRGNHWPRPDWYGGPVTGETRCGLCPCLEFHERADQEMRLTFQQETGE